MENTYLFYENARKYKFVVLILSIFCFLIFLTLFTFGILFYLKIITNIPDGNTFIPVSLVFLAISIYTFWAFHSKYLKNYIVISENEIEFFANNMIYKFKTVELTNFEIVKTSNWLMGNYKTFNLTFNNSSHFLITSFKSKELEKILNNLLKEST